MKQVFESNNISFVKVDESLVEDYLIMINDYENVNRFISSANKTFTSEQESKWVKEKLANNGLVFSMIEKKTNDFIGNIEFIEIKDKVGVFGIAITASKQDKGLGTEAIKAMLNYGFNELGLKKINLKARPFNDRAIHVYIKCGFKEYDRDDEHVYMEVEK